MNRLERYESLQDALRVAFRGERKEIWTAIPAIIESFDPATQTCTAQPAIQAAILQQDGSTKLVNLPVLVDVPVYFPAGGGFTLTFPVAAGDECLVVFSSRCIDAWWALGGIQRPMEYRFHDLSDGFAFVGISSVPKVIANISTTATELRSNDNATKVSVQSGTVTVTAASTIVNSTTATVNAATSATIISPSIILKNTGTALKKLLNSLFSTWAANHVHSNGNGGANTGPPTSVPDGTMETTVVQAE